MNLKCSEACRMMPWFVNESLEAGKRFEILSHLAVCPECRKELAFMIRIKKAVDVEIEESLDPRTSELMLDAIAKGIASEEASVNTKADWDDLIDNLRSDSNPASLMAAVYESITGLLRPSVLKYGESMKPAVTGIRFCLRAAREVLSTYA